MEDKLTILQQELQNRIRESGRSMNDISLAVSSKRSSGSKNNSLVRDIIKGRVKEPSYSILLLIADELECTVDDLYGKHTVSQNSENTAVPTKNITDVADVEWDYELLLACHKRAQEVLPNLGYKTAGKNAINTLAGKIYEKQIRKNELISSGVLPKDESRDISAFEVIELAKEIPEEILLGKGIQERS